MKLQAGLYIISTPIGNMGDITERALSFLRSCDHIFAEDTRVTKKLLAKHQITTKLGLYNDHSDEKVRLYIKDLVNQGMAIGLVSDAGTPLISDPGYKLVRDLQNEECHIDIAPGVSAPIAALTLSGLPTDRFMFNGFIPRTIPGKESFFTEISGIKATMIFFETANRLVSSLEVAARVLGNRESVVAREITKMYQTVKRDSLLGLAEFFTNHPARGEIVLLISGEPVEMPEIDMESEAKRLLDEGKSAKTVAGILHTRNPHHPKSQIYQMVNDVKKGSYIK